MTAVVGCLRYLPNKPGHRCGRPVDDDELLMCLEHARRERMRRRLDELIVYGGHHIRRDWRTNSGDLRDDWSFYVSEHTQIAEPRRSILERHLREEIDRCAVERIPGCNAQRAVSGASAELRERAASGASTAPTDRAMQCVSPVHDERAAPLESTGSEERPIQWDRFRLSRDDYSHT